MKCTIFAYFCLLVISAFYLVGAAPFLPIRSHQKRNTEVMVVENNGFGGYSHNRPGFGMGPFGMAGYGPGFGPGFGPGYGRYAGGMIGGIMGGIVSGPQWVASNDNPVPNSAPLVAIEDNLE